MITTHHRESNEDVNNKKALGFKLTMADDGQMMVAKTVGKNFAYLTYQQICASGVVHTTTFQQSIWLELPMKKKQITQYSASRHQFQHTKLCQSSFLNLKS
jgi:hypothetical protein